MPQSLRRGLLIRGVGSTSSRLRGVLPEISQGSSLLATLGFIAESLWDSRSLASINIRVRCARPRALQLPQCWRVYFDGIADDLEVAAPARAHSAAANFSKRQFPSARVCKMVAADPVMRHRRTVA